MITEMELGFSGICPVVALRTLCRVDLWHAGKRQEAFDMFGRILASTVSVPPTGRRVDRPRSL